jgi:heptaprenyl diphosphate synthase
MEFVDVYRRYKPELQQIETMLSDAVQSRNQALTNSSKQLLEAGGKRIRPLFALMCGTLGDGNRTKIYSLAAAMELVHMATLVHDDVIDDANVRRGRPTVRVQYGNRPAMYAGDFLFARAIQMLSTISIPEVHIRLAGAIAKMCEGEIDQIQDFYNTRQSFRRYFRRVQRKTALLIEMSCLLGALVGGAEERLVRSVGRFGRFTGMAFQIIDDILDVVGDESVVGKRVGGDLRQGNLTLPVLYALHCTPVGEEIRSLIREDMSDASVERCLYLVRSTGGVEYARSVAERYMDKALDALQPLHSTPVYDELRVVGEFINQRMY